MNSAARTARNSARERDTHSAQMCYIARHSRGLSDKNFQVRQWVVYFRGTGAVEYIHDWQPTEDGRNIVQAKDDG